MANAYEITTLNGASGTLPIIVTSTNLGTAQILHSAPANNNFQELWIDAWNTGENLEFLYVVMGQVDPKYVVTYPIPPKSGLTPIMKGRRIVNGMTIRCYASTSNVIAVTGEVNQIITS
jgi:hypothetical protein